MKKILLYSFLAIILLAVAGFAYAYTILKQDIKIPPLTEITKIEDIVQPYIDNEMTKGLSIGTFDNGKTEFYNFGICSDANPILPTENSIYEIGSITKTFTGAVLAEMVAEGKVNYDDPISIFLPDSVCNWSSDKAITLEQLSTHSSGLPAMPSNMMKKMISNIDNPYQDYTVADMYDYIKGYTPKDKADRKIEYSNLGTGLLGNILAKVDDLSYEKMVRNRIFQPLKMDDSLIEIAPGKMIQGHDAIGSPTSQWDLPAFAGAGAIRSNTKDMMKYLVANISDTKPYVDAHQPRMDMSDFQKIGLAWISQKNGDLAFTWHNGGTGGFMTFTGFSKEKQVGVIVLANSVQGVDAVGVRILEFLAKK